MDRKRQVELMQILDFDFRDNDTVVADTAAQRLRLSALEQLLTAAIQDHPASLVNSLSDLDAVEEWTEEWLVG